MNKAFPVTKLEIPLDQPQNAKLVLNGEVKTSLTSVNNAVNEQLLKQISISLTTAAQHASDLINHMTQGYITIVNEGTGSGRHTASFWITDTLDYRDASWCWKWDQGGLGFANSKNPETGEWEFQTTITQEGFIKGSQIEVGSIDADRIATGILKSRNENVVFNLNTGTLTMNAGSINIKNKFKVDANGNLTLAGNTTLGGNITWSSSPVQVLYAPYGYAPPDDGSKASDYPEDSDSGWHRVKSSSDEFATYTYNGGAKWNEAISIKEVPGYIQSTYIDSAKILSPDIYGGRFYATGQGRTDDQAAFYIYDGCTIGNNGVVALGNKIGYLSYDDQGAGTSEEAKKRVFLTSLNGVALKLNSGGNMSLEAGGDIFTMSPIRAAGGICVGSNSYGSTVPRTGKPGQLFFKT